MVLLGNKHGISAKRHRTIDEKANHLAAKTHVHDLFGWSVAISPINRDKFPDVLVGAPGTKVGGLTNAGAVYVLHGTKHGVGSKHVQRLTQATKGVPGDAQKKAQFGDTVRLAQLNHNAFADAIIAAPTASIGAKHSGFVVILRGSSHGLSRKHAKSITDSAANDLLGRAIA